MDTFLAHVARQLYADHPTDLDQVTVVFNNRRSGLFLRRQFAQLTQKPLFLPRIIGIDELVAELSGLEIVPNELLLFELFDIHNHIDQGERKYATFEEFIAFGDMMIADFSEIDLYCVDARQLFGNLHDLKVLGEWDIEAAPPTPFQQQYLHFYASLYQYYSQLRQRLLQQGKAYGGLAYRTVAEGMATLAPRLEGKEICFVGFNALSASEKSIIAHFVKTGHGKLYTDGDAYYYDDPQQEAGLFLRRHAADFADIGNYPHHFEEKDKRITLVSCPEAVLQCKYAGQLLKAAAQQAEGDSQEQTALVLGDEKLLLPTLNALPDEVRAANITMGYPFGNTAAHALMLTLFSLHQRRHGEYYYHQDLNDLLSDYCISHLLGVDDMHARLTAILAHRHIIYANADDLRELFAALRCEPESLQFLFPPAPPSPTEFLAMARQLTLLIYQRNVLDHNPRELEALATLLQTIDYFASLQERYHFVESLPTLQKIYTRLARRRSVAFYGEPLQGLQILGMLETRNLDFRRVILLSANEGVMPSGNNDNSLIPYNLKTAFGLPTYHEKDAVYAYNFYRLLQRAEEVHILYSTDTESAGKGEPSRFLLQLKHEMAPRLKGHIVLREEVVEATNAAAHDPYPQEQAKDDAILHRLREMAEEGFSPSALNKYRGCPLRFYFENVLRLRETEEVSEDLAQSDLGTCIHAILQEAYSRDSDHHIRVETLQGVIDDLDNILHAVLQEQFSHGRSHQGRNHFLETVAKKQVEAFLKSEIRRLQRGESIDIIGLEQPLQHRLATANGEVVIHGIADRIDRSGGLVRIIDYKSGKVDEKDLHVKELDADLLAVKDKWFQVMLYAWLYQQQEGAASACVSGIQPLGRLDSDLMVVSWGGEELLTRERLGHFKALLSQMVGDLMDAAIPFVASPSTETCRYCPFRETCA